MIPKAATIKKLRKVQEYIVMEPRRFDMNFWGMAVRDIDAFAKEYHFSDLADLRPPCGTAGCLAGNALVVAKLIKPKYRTDDKLEVFEFPDDTPQIAAKWLGIDEAEAAKLFYLGGDTDDLGWPHEFTEKYDQAETLRKRAKVLSQRIDHYIQTGE